MNGVVFSNEVNSFIKKVASEAIRPRVPFLLRTLVSPAVGIALNVFNKQADKIIPDSIDGYLNAVVEYVKVGDWDAAAASLGVAADTLVDIPNVDDVHEKNLFVTISQAIVQAIRVWIESKK